MYTVYKTVCLVNNKFYIGAHKTEDLNDDYLGSGTLLKRAIEKYGVENFEKEILFVFETAEEMFAKEAELVTIELINSGDSYNLKVGGIGGWDYILSEGLNLTESSRRKMSEAKKGKPCKVAGWNTGIKPSEETRQKISKSLKGNKNTLGFRYSDESKKKMSKSASGSNNSQYGTIWITDGVINRKIKIGEIPEGFRKGRS